jgi:hypothetical protein
VPGHSPRGQRRRGFPLRQKYLVAALQRLHGGAQRLALRRLRFYQLRLSAELVEDACNAQEKVSTQADSSKALSPSSGERAF